MAIAALAAEKKPPEDRNIVIRFDGVAAARAAGSRRNDGNPFRNARDTNIQEAADHNAKEKKEERDHSIDCATGQESAQRQDHRRVSDG